MIDKLHSQGFYFLKDIGCPGVYFLLEKGWLFAINIGLVYFQDVTLWNGFISILKPSNIRLSNVVDEMVWIQSKYGKYSPKDGYL